MNRMMGGGVNAGKKLHREISGIHTHTHQSRLENNHSAAFTRPKARSPRPCRHGDSMTDDDVHQL